MNSATLIQLDADDLRTLIREELSAAFAAQTGPTGFMKVPEAASFLSVSEDALRGMVKRGAVPVHKRGGRLFFDRVELAEWIKGGQAV